ncbi:hypothetical protein PF004_g29870 [Phytophthora fragariae]|uniref:RXLR phytopathogen effector protein WY-domain domain-containing protein n=2 Tax=Phytophthora fragariae TaxID=53985 RepID=A0A6G0MET6_9STRA|nr:hypothetical protein PF004_g29870 [Phytophthora fragariae]
MDNLLTSPLLSNWVAYVEKLNDNPYSILLGKLKTSKLTDTDDKLVEMIMKAKREASTSVIAGKLEAAQLEKWLGEKQTAADVFGLLKFDEEGGHLLWRPSVRAWVAYVMKLDPHKSDDVILSVLKPHYSDEKLAQMLSLGYGHNDEIAARLTKAALKKWLGERKSADDVFDFVLKQHGEFVFESRDLDTWVSYVMMLDKVDPYKTMFKVLQKRFDKSKLNSMVSYAIKNSRTKELGWKLNQEIWLSESMTAETVFYRLRLDRDRITLFTHPKLTMWISHVTKLDKKKADELMLAVLQPLYSKKQLTKLISAAKKVDETKEFATRLEKQLLRSQGK